MAQDETSLVLKAAELKIGGKTNISDFNCNLRKTNINDTLSRRHSKAEGPEIFEGLQLFFEVTDFTCDLALMTRDFQHLLQSEKYPRIILTIDDLQYNNPLPGQTSGAVTAFVQLTIADEKRGEKIEQASIHKFRKNTILSGTHHILMTAFDIIPPTKLFGTVRTEDLLEIQFNIQLE